MIDNKTRAHDLAMLYMQEMVRQSAFNSPDIDTFKEFTLSYSNAYLSIYELLNAECMVDDN